MRSLTYVISLITLSIPAYAGDYYVDAENGSDATGDGSAGNPWKTINYAFSRVTAYDGDGVDTLHLSGQFYEEGTATAQSDDDGITITGGTFGYVEDYRDDVRLTLDVTAADDVNITENEFHDVSVILGNGSNIVDNDSISEQYHGYSAGIYSTDKDNVTIYGNSIVTGGLNEGGALGINVSGGSGHTIKNNSAGHLYIDVIDVSSGTIGHNSGASSLPDQCCADITCENSAVGLLNNDCVLAISGVEAPYISDNYLYGLEVDFSGSGTVDVVNNEIYGTHFSDDVFVLSFGPNGNCLFGGNIFICYGLDAVYLNLMSGGFVVEDCYCEEGSGIPMFIRVQGGTADFGGGPLGSSGNNDFSEVYSFGEPEEPEDAFIWDNTGNDIYALNNTWDSDICDQMDGHYYDTYDIEEFYDKWEDASKGFVIWSEPDPNGPVPAFDLLSPEDGELVDISTPTLDWEDVPECPWVDLDHFDLYVDTDSEFADPGVYGGLTDSEYTFSDPLDDGVTYYWKILALDDQGNDRWSEQTDWSFTVETGSLGDFSLISPEQGETVHTLTPTLDWEDSVPGYRVRDLSHDAFTRTGARYSKPGGRACELDHYDVWLDTNPDYTDPTIYTDITDSTFTLTENLDDQTDYYWKVVAVDNLGREKWCAELEWWFHVDEAGHLSDFSLLSPVKAETVATRTPTLDWEDSIPEYDGRKSALAIIERTAPFGDAGVYTSLKIPRNGGDRLCELDHYDIWLDTDPDYADPAIYTDITDSTFTFTEQLDDFTIYYWKVVAVDDRGREKWCNELDWWFNIDTTLNIVPASFGRIKASFGGCGTLGYDNALRRK